MPIDSTLSLIDTLRQLRLLLPGQSEELPRLQGRFSEPKAMARELLQRGWLTPYQINQIFLGRGAALLLGQYNLLEKLGEGGMGTVFKARHQRLERIVALKLIRKERMTSPDTIQRFQHEARAAARVSHPNIVTIHDADEVAGTHFFVMEYVEGTDLAVAGGPGLRLRPPGGPGFAGRRRARAGAPRHKAGQSHPDHQRRCQDPGHGHGASRKTGRGIRRWHGCVDARGRGHGHSRLHGPRAGHRPHRADVRADLYSLGCTLFFLLAGKAPFAGGTMSEKLLKHQMEPARPIEELRPDLPPGLGALVRKLMANANGTVFILRLRQPEVSGKSSP